MAIILGIIGFGYGVIAGRAALYCTVADRRTKDDLPSRLKLIMRAWRKSNHQFDL